VWISVKLGELRKRIERSIKTLDLSQLQLERDLEDAVKLEKFLVSSADCRAPELVQQGKSLLKAVGRPEHAVAGDQGEAESARVSDSASNRKGLVAQ
jgi:hypothetical protein